MHKAASLDQAGMRVRRPEPGVFGAPAAAPIADQLGVEQAGVSLGVELIPRKLTGEQSLLTQGYRIAFDCILV